MNPTSELAAARLRRVRHPGPIGGAEDPRHGTDTGYVAGCREECCRHAHAVRRKVDRLYPNQASLVDSTGARRRLEALACLGWSAAVLARRIGKHRSYLLKVQRNDRIQVATAAIVADLYAQLSTAPCTEPSAGRTAAIAKAKGLQPPEAWFDIDDPNETPDPGWRPRHSKQRSKVEVLEEFDFLVSQGESREQAAARLGVRLYTITDYRTQLAKEAS